MTDMSDRVFIPARSGRWSVTLPEAPMLVLDAALGRARADMRFYLGEMPELIDRLTAPNARGRMITVCNTHMLVAAGQDPDLAAAMRGAAFGICDGQPIAWLLSLLSGRAVSRITGPDVFEAVLNERLADCRVAIVGSNDATLARLAEHLPAGRRANLLLINPGQVTEGAGPSEEIVTRLNAFGARVVFVGLGCPKQEKWMARAITRVPSTFLGVGAALDYGVDDIRRAPRIMQIAGTEWIYRMAQQPRLVRRYAATLLPFAAIFALGLRSALTRRLPAPVGSL